MKFLDFVAVIKRHKLFVVDGLLIAVLLATFAAYRIDGSRLVSRTPPLYETTAVVSVKPGPEVVASTTVPAPTTTAVDADGDFGTTTQAPTTTVADARLDDVIDSRGLYYAALSIKTIVVSPGFSEAVKANVPVMDGSISAVVALDTNTLTVVANGSTPTAAAETMAGALAELNAVVASYATSPSVRFTLDGVVISAPSTPTAVSSFKGPLTFVLVLAISVGLLWLIVRLVDTAQQQRRRTKRRTPPADSTLDPVNGPDFPGPVFRDADLADGELVEPDLVEPGRSELPHEPSVTATRT